MGTVYEHRLEAYEYRRSNCTESMHLLTYVYHFLHLVPPGRHTIDVNISKYLLAEYYWPAFKAPIKHADAKGVMCVSASPSVL
jgi:hypothetical protein